MSIIPAITSSEPSGIETQLLPTFTGMPDFAFSEIGSPPESTAQYVAVVSVDVQITSHDLNFDQRNAAALLRERQSWADQESREFYAEAAVEQGLAYQIKVNREQRGMSQRELADIVGTRQSAVSRMEDPEYGSHSIPKLLKVAHAFDCALLIKLVPFSILAAEAEHLSEHDLYAASYNEEMQEG